MSVPIKNASVVHLPAAMQEEDEAPDYSEGATFLAFFGPASAASMLKDFGLDISNGFRLRAEVSDGSIVRPGDRIRVGETAYRVEGVQVRDFGTAADHVAIALIELQYADTHD